MNDYCVRKLFAPLGSLSAREALGRSVALAATTFGDGLIAVVAFGSWARGEAADGSDLDLLVVVDAGVRIDRGTYRAWDAVPIPRTDHPVDAHFLHLPEPGTPIAGIWAEAALDGIVLFDRGLRLSRRLIEIRHDVASGRIVRRFSHGQPYWIDGAAA